MRRLLFCIIFICIPHSAFALKSTICAGPVDDIQCFAATNYADQDAATRAVFQACGRYFGNLASKYCNGLTVHQGSNMCDAAAYYQGHGYLQNGSTPAEAQKEALTACNRSLTGPCKIILTVCDGTADEQPYPKLITSIQGPPPERILDSLKGLSNILNMGALGSGISFGIGLVIALLIYAKRAAIANFVIHGNLPYKLPVYGEDIQCLFKRTQRVNWYGRVVFGIVVNLTMTHPQLADVRKYWLGRVIAFDSLRRQRQNELARMHMQLAASVKSDPHDKKKFWSRRWATIRTFIRRLFWIFTAFFRFLLSFFFIRVTLAKLIRGTIVESKDLVLILQAKDAIEESTTYLKEYLTTANTFDDRDEIYEPQ